MNLYTILGWFVIVAWALGGALEVDSQTELSRSRGTRIPFAPVLRFSSGKLKLVNEKSVNRC